MKYFKYNRDMLPSTLTLPAPPTARSYLTYNKVESPLSLVAIGAVAHKQVSIQGHALIHYLVSEVDQTLSQLAAAPPRLVWNAAH